MKTGTEQLCGTIEKIVYKNEANGFAIITLSVKAHDAVTAKGYFPDIHQGATVNLKGSWTFHQKFGRQFEVAECTTSLPSSVVGIEKYLASGLVKGIGPAFAERLVKAFGAATLDIIDQEPSRLLTVPGVGPKRVESITKAWVDQKEISKVMVFLRSKDVSAAFATKIFKTYGNASIEKIEANPYQLVDDIWGIGFKSADKIALKMGLETDSLERVKAGILYSISEATSDGHLYMELEPLRTSVIEILEIDATTSQERIKTALTQLYQNEKIKLITHKEKNFITLPKFYHSEKGIAKKILRMLESPQARFTPDTSTVYQALRFPDAKGIELNEDQQRGILACLQNKISIITGGPGTGKTTLVKRLITFLEENRVKFRLAAPTGRAAKRMFESTGKHTETLHRLLEFTPATMNFARNEENALEVDVMIVDEASMIDVFLMHSLLKAMPLNARLLLLGDIDQLPSVGAGNVLNDLIATKKISVTRLTKIFRQAQDSMIIVNAHRINRGEFPTHTTPGSRKDFLFFKEETPENIFPLLQSLYTKKLAQHGIDPKDAIVLVPMNRGVVGTQRLNQELQNILNPITDGPTLSVFGQLYKINDRVMQIRNNYEKFVFNGDIGFIKSINQADQVLVICFGDRDVEYDFAEANELTLSYAISIHKSQGSEFQAVIIPIFMQHFILLQRNLIYTAVTRAKKLCILIGQPKAIAMGIRNARSVDRLTFLKEFLTSDVQAR
ncbi:MAG: ATP-dependent RecD-like DNA helicase [Candidatus Babeliales bacterium]